MKASSAEVATFAVAAPLEAGDVALNPARREAAREVDDAVLHPARLERVDDVEDAERSLHQEPASERRRKFAKARARKRWGSKNRFGRK